MVCLSLRSNSEPDKVANSQATAALLNGLAFTGYHFFLNVQRESNDAMPTLTQVAIAGGLTGLIGSSVFFLLLSLLIHPTNSIVITPTELVKIRQQDQLVRTSTSQIVRQIFRQSGVPGLYRGIWATILRDFGGCAAYFVGVGIETRTHCRFSWLIATSTRLPVGYSQHLVRRVVCPGTHLC